jgi:hypothetical protein
MEEIELHSHIKMEMAKGRTYGECVMDEIASIKMINGEFRTTLHIKEKPKRAYVKIDRHANGILIKESDFEKEFCHYVFEEDD